MRGEGATVWIERPGGRVAIEELADAQRRVVVHPNPGTFVSRSECVTRYPIDLIERIVDVKSPSYVCDEIARDEDPDYVGLFMRYGLLGYVPKEEFRGARLLDFGSGSGASTVILARMFPDTEIVGVELEPALIELAKLRAAHYGMSNLVFLQSPSPETLPSDLGTFPFVQMHAVYEHLLPTERPSMCAQLWGLLEVNGVIFVNELPHRFYPVEAHTTGLPLLNYLPDRLAHRAAARLSRRIAPDATWPELLRAGIRGGTARSVRRDLLSDGGRADMLTPTGLGLRDHTDLWYGYSAARRPHPIKRAMRVSFRIASRIAGDPFAPGLSLAFRKLA
jgi:2-polyprenyl-3-methyl-5-hydroxy-6-metoxy-1,4-benzoquinol methylase